MTRLMSFTLVTTFSASLAMAQSTMTEPTHFQLWDLDRDKTVTLTELENRLLAVMVEFDKDGDGALSNEEYDAFDKAREAEAAEHDGSLTRRAVAGLSRGYTDSNFDGKVTREELLEAGRSWFYSMDRNGDGQIDAQDFQDASQFTNDS
ncbi:hypothetical protein [uncultured Shimia sp.]|uniref:hypothetical protein n=1 Tax=uncultured Shimia sp. TaxID=573152 RepID=UPI002638B576|nr:hypothetical protein [uncultured Shimia sp.]